MHRTCRMDLGPEWSAVAADSILHIKCWSDNAAAVAWNNSVYSSNISSQEINRAIELAESLFSIRISSQHLPGSANKMADTGSRAWSEPHSTDWANISSSWQQVQAQHQFRKTYTTLSSSCSSDRWPRPRSPSTRLNVVPVVRLEVPGGCAGFHAHPSMTRLVTTWSAANRWKPRRAKYKQRLAKKRRVRGIKARADAIKAMASTNPGICIEIPFSKSSASQHTTCNSSRNSKVANSHIGTGEMKAWGVRTHPAETKAKRGHSMSFGTVPPRDGSGALLHVDGHQSEWMQAPTFNSGFSTWNFLTHRMWLGMCCLSSWTRPTRWWTSAWTSSAPYHLCYGKTLRR